MNAIAVRQVLAGFEAADIFIFRSKTYVKVLIAFAVDEYFSHLISRPGP